MRRIYEYITENLTLYLILCIYNFTT